MRSQDVILNDLAASITRTGAAHARYASATTPEPPPEERAFLANVFSDIREAVARERQAREAVVAPNMRYYVAVTPEGPRKAVLIDGRSTPTPRDPLLAEVEALLDRGFSCAESGDRDGAIRTFREACAIHPDNRTATFQLAWHLSCAGALNEAINLYLRLLQKDFLDEHVWCNIAGILSALGLRALARLFFEVSLLLDPNDDLALQGLKLSEG